MLLQYHSELGGKAKYSTTAKYNPFNKKWHVRTYEELEGSGIKFFEKACDGTNRNVYTLTDKAFEKLCASLNVSQELLFD